jgi:sirohydrochlorin cobaltochelatase
VRDGALEQMLEAELAAGSLVIGEISVRKLEDSAFELAHRSADFQSVGHAGFQPALSGRRDACPPHRRDACAPDAALEIAKRDDAGNYRPLRTAPNLRRDWKIIAPNLAAVIEVIDDIYPGRQPAWRAWKTGSLTTTSLRATLSRQSGMYRVASQISDSEINELVGNFCRSDGGCLRTILWRRDHNRAIASTQLPIEKFDPAFDQFVPDEEPRPATAATACIPLLCQEACGLLVAACRDVVKDRAAARP